MLHIIMYARVVELVDTLVLGTSASRREGSSPFSRTKKLYKNRPLLEGGFFINNHIVQPIKAIQRLF